METPSPYGSDEHMEKYRAERAAREQAERDSKAEVLGADWQPSRPADLRVWDVVAPPKFKKDYPGQFVRALDIPRWFSGDAVPDNAVMRIRARYTGAGASGGDVILSCDWHCPCCGHAHGKDIKESAIAEGTLQFLAPGDNHATQAAGRRIVYLAAPYTHPDPAVRQERWLEASRAAAWLMGVGHSVISPISMGHPVGVMGAEGDWAAWQHTCLAMLDAANVLFVLDIDGWKDSTGVRAEACHALKSGKPIWQLARRPHDDVSYYINPLRDRWW